MIGLSSSYETMLGPQGLSRDLNLTPETDNALGTLGTKRLAAGVLADARRERCRADCGATRTVLAETGRRSAFETAFRAELTDMLIVWQL